MADLKYLVMTVTNRNFIHGDIKSALNSDNACYHSVQSFAPSHFLSKNFKIKTHKTVNLPVFCMGVRLGLLH
jgi:hypothetical protein